MDTGDKAKAYANGFIGRHLTKIANGQTYSEVSAKAQADPSDHKLAGQVQVLFRGETLRGLLLNAYGWWTIGTYAFYAAIGLAIAGLVVLGAFVFELMGRSTQGRLSSASRPRQSGRRPNRKRLQAALPGQCRRALAGEGRPDSLTD